MDMFHRNRRSILITKFICFAQTNRNSVRFLDFFTRDYNTKLKQTTKTTKPYTCSHCVKIHSYKQNLYNTTQAELLPRL